MQGSSGKLNLSTSEVVKRKILRNELPQGERINETRLAEDLGISRTPLREALNVLQSSDLVRSDKGRGFYVTPLTRTDALELYSLLGILESTMLRNIGIQAMANIRQLQTLNQGIIDDFNNANLIDERDNQLHQLMLSSGDNQRVKRLISQHWQQIERYEYIYKRQADWVHVSIMQHSKIIEALANMDIDLAARLLEHHWQFCGQTLADQF